MMGPPSKEEIERKASEFWETLDSLDPWTIEKIFSETEKSILGYKSRAQTLRMRYRVAKAEEYVKESKLKVGQTVHVVRNSVDDITGEPLTGLIIGKLTDLRRTKATLRGVSNFGESPNWSDSYDWEVDILNVVKNYNEPSPGHKPGDSVKLRRGYYSQGDIRDKGVGIVVKLTRDWRFNIQNCLVQWSRVSGPPEELYEGFLERVG